MRRSFCRDQRILVNIGEIGASGGWHGLRTADALTRSVEAVERRAAEALAQVRDELRRLGDTMGAKLERSDAANVVTLEKLNVEIVRVADGFSTNGSRRLSFVPPGQGKVSLTALRYSANDLRTNGRNRRSNSPNTFVGAKFAWPN
jgi:hypothetical protein